MMILCYAFSDELKRPLEFFLLDFFDNFMKIHPNKDTK